MKSRRAFEFHPINLYLWSMSKVTDTHTVITYLSKRYLGEGLKIAFCDVSRYVLRPPSSNHEGTSFRQTVRAPGQTAIHGCSYSYPE